MKKNKILILSVAVIILLIIIIAFSRNKKQEYTDAMQAVYLEKDGRDAGCLSGKRRREQYLCKP